MINYSKLQVAEGSLPKLIIQTGIAGGTGITITYETDTQIVRVLPTDQVVAFALLRKGSLVVARQIRGSEPLESILIPAPGIQATDVVCCYVFILNEDGSKASDSVFVQVN